MRRVLAAVLLSLAVVGDAAAQWRPASRFESADARGERLPPPGIVGAQLLVSTVGMAAGGLVGGFVGAAAVGGSGDAWVDLGVILGGVILGGMFGSSWAVHAYSQRAGYAAPYWGALLGSAAGIVGGQYFYVTMPIGAVVGHNLARRPEK